MDAQKNRRDSLTKPLSNWNISNMFLAKFINDRKIFNDLRRRKKKINQNNSIKIKTYSNYTVEKNFCFIFCSCCTQLNVESIHITILDYMQTMWIRQLIIRLTHDNWINKA